VAGGTKSGAIIQLAHNVKTPLKNMGPIKDIGRPAIPLFTCLFSGEGKMEYTRFAIAQNTEVKG
jgi:hypothetical protein